MRSVVKIGIAALCAAAVLGFVGSPRAHADICGDLTPPLDTNGSFQNSCGANADTVYLGDLFGPADGADVYGTDIVGPAHVVATVQDSTAPPRCVNAYLYNNSGNLLVSNANCGSGGQAGAQLVYDAPTSGAIFLVVTQPPPLLAGPNRYQFQLTSAGVPLSPTTLYVTPKSDTSVSVEWVANSTNQTGFDLELNGGTPRSVTSSPYLWTGLTPAQKGCFRVRAHNAVGNSGWYPSTSPSDICATTPDAARNVAGAPGGVQPGPPSASPPPSPPPAPDALGPPRTAAPPATIVAPGPSAPAPTPPAAEPPRQPLAPSRPSNARCSAARSTIRRALARVSADRAQLRRATTRRARARARGRLSADEQRLAQARRRARRVC